MTLDFCTRKLIKSYIDSGLTATEIYKKLNKTVPRTSVYRWYAHITRGQILAKSPPGRPRNVRTKEFIAKIKRKVCLNKKRKSARKIAKEEGCSNMTVRRVIHEGLCLNTYKKTGAQALTNDQIQRRKSFSHWIRKYFNHESCRSIMFSDEKWFDQDGQYNRQNDCVYAESREAANKDFGTSPVHKFPYKVMVWAGITFNGGYSAPENVIR